MKKTALKDYDSPRSGGVIAINLRETEDGSDDELIGAELVSAEDDLLLISKKAQSIRFTATDDALRPMGRATSGVKGMSFREGDELLSMSVVRPGTFVFTATDGGYAKRTAVDEYRVQGRGGLGIKAAKIVEDRGSLVGALVVDETDEILAITLGGGVIRTRVNEVRETGRDTMGVQLINLGKRDAWSASPATPKPVRRPTRWTRTRSRPRGPTHRPPRPPRARSLRPGSTRSKS